VEDRPCGQEHESEQGARNTTPAATRRRRQPSTNAVQAAFTIN
jgi:hypothetical protein